MCGRLLLGTVLKSREELRVPIWLVGSCEPDGIFDSCEVRKHDDDGLWKAGMEIGGVVV